MHTTSKGVLIRPITTKTVLSILGLGVILAVAGFVALRASPWPTALRMRYLADDNSMVVSRALEKHVPPGITAVLNQHYDAADRDAYLDVFYPSNIANTGRALLTIVWVHGGWVSGSKDNIANYAKILASIGYTVVGVDYSLAPGRIYPTPNRQVNAALTYLVKNARRLHVDPARFVLAGDSDGANIAAIVANAMEVPSYAKALGIVPAVAPSQIVGLVLYCGLFGPFEDVQKTMLWLYSGRKNFKTSPRFAAAQVINYVTGDFPPTFISVGNSDPFLPQSVGFATKLSERGVRVDGLFFPKDYKPAVPHEYQFDLDNDAGKLALERSAKFLSGLASANARPTVIQSPTRPTHRFP